MEFHRVRSSESALSLQAFCFRASDLDFGDWHVTNPMLAETEHLSPKNKFWLERLKINRDCYTMCSLTLIEFFLDHCECSPAQAGIPRFSVAKPFEMEDLSRASGYTASSFVPPSGWFTDTLFCLLVPPNRRIEARSRDRASSFSRLVRLYRHYMHWRRPTRLAWPIDTLLALGGDGSPRRDHSRLQFLA